MFWRWGIVLSGSRMYSRGRKGHLVWPPPDWRAHAHEYFLWAAPLHLEYSGFSSVFEEEPLTTSTSSVCICISCQHLTDGWSLSRVLHASQLETSGKTQQLSFCSNYLLPSCAALSALIDLYFPTHMGNVVIANGMALGGLSYGFVKKPPSHALGLQARREWDRNCNFKVISPLDFFC